LHPQGLQHCHSFSPCRRLQPPPLLLLPLPVVLVVLVLLLVVLSACMTCESSLLPHDGWCCCIRSLLKSAEGEETPSQEGRALCDVVNGMAWLRLQFAALFAALFVASLPAYLQQHMLYFWLPLMRHRLARRIF
jgi:hypothetical protein